MDILHAIILGVVEGFTEYLPISSTGHMIVVSDWLGMEQTDALKAFEVIIQLAAILAVIVLFKEKFTFKKRELWKKVCVAAFPLLSIGFIFRHQVKELFSVLVVAVMFVIGGICFLLVEKWYASKGERVSDVEKITYKQAVVIGIAQVFALIPGTSRAGATIIGGLLSGISRKASAEFSFLLAFPIMMCVSGYDIVKNRHEFMDQNALVLLVGFITAFVVAFVTIKLFLTFLEKCTFISFGVYRIIFGLLLLYFYT